MKLNIANVHTVGTNNLIVTNQLNEWLPIVEQIWMALSHGLIHVAVQQANLVSQCFPHDLIWN